MHQTVAALFKFNIFGFKTQSRGIGTINTQHIAVQCHGVIAAQRLINGKLPAGMVVGVPDGTIRAGQVACATTILLSTLTPV